MDKVNVELAALKSVLSHALEQVETLQQTAAAKDSQSVDSDINLVKLNDADLIVQAEKFLRWCRVKADILNMGTGLFSDSCWIMCLDIYICDLKDEQVTVSAVAHSSGVPMTTAMRYINVMAEEGLLEKSPNPSDHRMIFVSTSPDCKEKISTILTQLP